ncbi:DUF3726 domain-containing protein [Amorphus orientalis]|uniref:DUF3726 domain-containing protein n=1 Tax=Amorphus orientalis TaxID=649198 RepID=A0AAE3VPA2_9HYPH|nr:DUF3726 domain-containing protein [Amorphus orientalis]MDQ0315592.1 hypothetical protein [Amorphus orientalis]
MTTLSLNEVEQSIRKAAVGAGLPQGTAYETGRAAGWLAVAGLPAFTISADALEAAHAGATAGARVTHLDGGWLIEPADDRPLCPCRAGVAAADLLNAGAQSVTLKTVAWPILAVALLTVLTETRSAVVRLGGGDNPDSAPGLAVRGGVATASTHDTLAAAQISATDLTVTASEAAAPAPGTSYGDAAARRRTVTDGVSPDPAAADRIARLIANTLVPASDLSRDRGAGAGLIDSN